MRATDGRPYELKSVPTKTVAIRTTENCADLVQNFAHTFGYQLSAFGYLLAAVSAVPSSPGYRNHRIRRCVRSPLKISF